MTNTYPLRKILVVFSCILLCVMLLFPVLSRAEEKDDAYWEHVGEVQKKIRTSKTVKYGMTPVYGLFVKDGDYEISAWSNSTYFKISKAVLHVKSGLMTAEITIPSMSYLNVYMGTTKEAADADEKDWIPFREVNNQTVFEIPVEALDKEILCAALSKARKKWYDRKLVFDATSLPEEALLLELPDYELIEDALRAYGAEEAAVAQAVLEQEEETEAEENPDSGQKPGALIEGTPEAVPIDLPDGEYSIEVNMVGGSGRASISSPTWMNVKDGKAYARLLWSSSYYDYMIIGDQKFYNLTTDGGNSVFEIPIVRMDESIPVIADTTAMGDPVEIRYELTFYSETAGPKSRIPQEAAIRVLIIAAVILAVGAVLNIIIKRKKKK